MAAILLDVDGVLHVSGDPIPGAADAVQRLRDNGHRLRFTNNTTRSRAQLVAELVGQGIEVDPEEVQTVAAAAVKALTGKRVLALVMHAIVGDLDGIELVGDGADVVLLGGADETPETNLVFSYMNLARAFAELELGAELYCLHRNRWWQTKHGPQFDSARIRRGLEYGGVEAVVLGKPSSSYRDGEALGRPAHDLDGRRRSRERRGVPRNRHEDRARAHRKGRRRRARAHAALDGIVSSIGTRPSGSRNTCDHVGDLIEIVRVRRSLERYESFPRPRFTPAESWRHFRRIRPRATPPLCRRRSRRWRRASRVARAFAWKDIEIVGRPKPLCPLPVASRPLRNASAPARSTCR